MMTISTLVGNLNSGLSYHITAVLTASFAVPTVYHKKLILLTLLGSGSEWPKALLLTMVLYLTDRLGGKEAWCPNHFS